MFHCNVDQCKCSCETVFRTVKISASVGVIYVCVSQSKAVQAFVSNVVSVKISEGDRVRWCCSIHTSGDDISLQLRIVFINVCVRCYFIPIKSINIL